MKVRFSVFVLLCLLCCNLLFAVAVAPVFTASASAVSGVNVLPYSEVSAAECPAEQTQTIATDEGVTYIQGSQADPQAMSDVTDLSQLISDTSEFFDDVTDLFCGSSSQKISEQVYLGGYPLGLTIDGDGVTVIGLNEFFDVQGELACPAMNAGIQINDVIIELDNRKIFSSAKLVEIASASNGKPLEIKYIRQGQTHTATITPQADLAAGQYRLGLWTRDSSSGIGTLTYVRKNLKFGSLGHPITDPNGEIVSCDNGGVFNCTINGVNKGKRGAAGELKGTFSFEKRIGNLYLNNKYGAFGTFNTLPAFCTNLMPVADVNEVAVGKAQIYCTINGNTPEYFDIEIVKANRQTSKNDKGMVIHVTDKRLLEISGGIVQGMSGSPIVQNGKLVGAVTHVFVNDPTRGYGIYAKWMLEN